MLWVRKFLSSLPADSHTRALVPYERVEEPVARREAAVSGGIAKNGPLFPILSLSLG